MISIDNQQEILDNIGEFTDLNSSEILNLLDDSVGGMINDPEAWIGEERGRQRYVSTELKSDENGLKIVVNCEWTNWEYAGESDELIQHMEDSEFEWNAWEIVITPNKLQTALDLL